jgi:hypothetical protein
MTTPIDCETLRQHREEYLRGGGPVDLVEAHLATCPSCLDAFLDDVLATPMTVMPPWGFATRVVAHLPPASATGPRMSVLVISTLIGIVLAALLMSAGDSSGPMQLLMRPDAFALEAAVPAECVLLFWLLSRRRGVLVD